MSHSTIKPLVNYGISDNLCKNKGIGSPVRQDMKNAVLPPFPGRRATIQKRAALRAASMVSGLCIANPFKSSTLTLGPGTCVEHM